MDVVTQVIVHSLQKASENPVWIAVSVGEAWRPQTHGRGDHPGTC